MCLKQLKSRSKEMAGKKINWAQKVQFCLGVLRQRGDSIRSANFEFQIFSLFDYERKERKPLKKSHNRPKFAFFFYYQVLFFLMISYRKWAVVIGPRSAFYPKLFDNSGTTLKIRVGTTISTCRTTIFQWIAKCTKSTVIAWREEASL